MFQRTPREGQAFASIWIGAKLTTLAGDGQFDLVSHGPALTKKTSQWWSVKAMERDLFPSSWIFSPKSSALEEQPTYLGMKPSGERQECISVAVLKDGMVCLHNWFCSMATHTLCEIRKWRLSLPVRYPLFEDPPPPPPDKGERLSPFSTFIARSFRLDDQLEALKSKLFIRSEVPWSLFFRRIESYVALLGYWRWGSRSCTR